MSKPTYLATLPFFNGFYNSLLSGEVDNAEEQDAEHYAKQESEEGYPPDTDEPRPLDVPRNMVPAHPEHLRLTAGEFASIFFDCTDYKATYLKIAQEWVEGFDDWCKEHLGTPEKSFVWESMTSPKEYNFTSDTVYADVSAEVVEMLFSKSAEEDHKTLEKCIKGTFTSYDGFSSFYSNRLETWLEKPLEEWDHNEIGTLVAASIKASDEWSDRGEFSMSLYYYIFEGGDDYRVVDWPRFEAKVAELRAEKQEAHDEAEKEVTKG